MKNLKLLIGALVICLFAGCSNKVITTNDRYTDVVHQHKEIYVELDENGYVFDYVLDNLDDYIEGKISEEKMIEFVQTTMGDFKQQLEDVEPYRIDDEFNEVLVGNDIVPKDFEQFANFRVPQLTEMVGQLEKIYNVLTVQKGDLQKETLKIISEKYSNVQENYKKYYFYGCFNYFFSSWGNVQTKYAMDIIVPEVREYIVEDFVWENDKEVLNNNITGYLAEIDKDLKAVEELELGNEAVEEVVEEPVQEAE